MNATVLHLPRARSLALVDVATLTDSRTYARGVAYVRRGKVQVSDRADDAVTAVVSGSAAYVVRLAVGRRGVEHRCSCPVGTEGGFCKHLVAVALAAAGDDIDDEDGWESHARDLLDELDALLAAGRVAQVIEFCDRAAAYLDDCADLADDDVAVSRLAARICQIRLRAVDLEGAVESSF